MIFNRFFGNETSSWRSKPLLTLVLVVAGTVSANAIAATYYVDTNNAKANDSNLGTAALPWKSISKAASTMVGGDTAVISAGAYGSVTTVRSGSAGNRIVFMAYGVVNTGSWTISNDYITVKGFRLARAEVTIKNANNCEVLNNEIIAGSISWSTLANSDSCLVMGNNLHGATSPSGDWPQINIFGTNHVIEGNEIGPSSDIDAFRIFGSNHVIRNNYVHDITYSPGSLAHMDMFQTFGDNGWVSNNIVIENNRFINSQGQLFNTSQDNISGIHDYIVRNNVFANISQNANVGLPNFYFYNNTVYNTGIIYQVTGGPGKPFNGSNLVVKNNILVGLAGCSNKDFDNVFNNPSGLPMTRSNNFYANCAGQAMTNYTSESGGINGGAVNFVNPGAYDLSINSPSTAIKGGAILPGFSYDILGKTRPTGAAWDLGAYQFLGTALTLQAPTNLKAQ
jgi:hypothetical protein